MTTIRKAQWKPGESGNIKGRPKGIGKVAQLRDEISKHILAIIQQLVAKAKEGDAQAAKLLLERVIPSMRPVEEPVNINPPESTELYDQGQSIMNAVSTGQLAPGQGSALITGLSSLAKVKEIDELEKRLAVLEEANDNNK